MKASALALVLLLTACGGAGGSGSRDPRDARDPNWRDSSPRGDNSAPPRDFVREPHKDVKDHKGK